MSRISETGRVAGIDPDLERCADFIITEPHDSRQRERYCLTQRQPWLNAMQFGAFCADTLLFVTACSLLR
jgi:hypothetical protein